MNIAVFASGNGSNFQAIAEAGRRGELGAGRVALLVCDKGDAGVLERARRLNVEAFLIEAKKYPSKQQYEKEILKKLKEKKIELIALAGYMRLVGVTLLKAFPHRILNIHPALLPSFKGTDGIGEALDYGVKVTGVTVHFVDGGMDSGPVILQEAVPVQEGDTKETLAPRIHEVEHRIYPKAIRLLAEGKLVVKGRQVSSKD